MAPDGFWTLRIERWEVGNTLNVAQTVWNVNKL